MALLQNSCQDEDIQCVDKTGFFCLVSFVRLITGCFRVLVDSLRLRFHASVWISVPVDKILFVSVLL